MFGGPAFVQPAGAGLQGDPMGAVSGPAGAQGGGGGGVFGEPDKVVVYGHAEPGEDGKIPVHGVGVIGAAGDGDIVETARAFAGFVETHEKFPAREPGKRAAAGETLEIDHEVKLLGAQPADAADHFRPMRRACPAAAFEAHHVRQVGIALEQRGEAGINPPENFCLGEMLFQQTQHGHGLDDIAERTGFEDQDFQRFKV